MLTPATLLTQAELQAAIVHDPLVVAPQTTVIDAIAYMSGVRNLCSSDQATTRPLDTLHLEARSSCVLVVESAKILGILTERDIVRLSVQQCSLDTLTVGEVMASSVITLHESEFTDLFFAVNLLQQHRIRHIPILNQHDRLMGIITHESLRQLARPADLLRLRLVSEVMTTEVICADPFTPMLAIAHLMADHQVGSVLIVQASDAAEDVPLQIPIGIITERDIVQFQSLRLNLETVQVQSVMSTPVFSVRPDDSLVVVQQIMEQRSIRRLVVTGTQNELLGIVTQTSLLQALNPLELYNLAKILEQKVSQLEAEKNKLLEAYTHELEQQVEQRTAELKWRAEREQLMARIADQIRASLNLPDILETTVRELRSFLGCDRVLIYQFQPDWRGLVVSESVEEGWRASLHDIIDDPCFRDQMVARYGKAQTCGEAQTIAIDNIHTFGYPTCYVELLESYQVKSNLVVPIQVAGKLWGLLIGHQCAEYRAWQEGDLTLLDEMSVQLAIALQQAMAYQQVHIELIERQKVESALRHSEQRFRAIFDNMFQFVMLLSPDGILLEANQTALVAAEIEHDQVVHRPFWQAHWWQISPETQARLQQAIAQAAQGELVRYEAKVWGANQTVLPIDFCLRPILDEAGQVVSLIAEGRDLSEAKRIERDRKKAAAARLHTEKLTQDLTLLENVLNIVLAGYWDWDLPNNQRYLSLGFKRMFGYEDHELPNSLETWQSLIFAEDLSGMMECFDRHVQSHGEVPYYNEVRYRHKNGSTIWVICSGQVIEWSTEGHPLRMIGCHIDITERKQAEAALQESEEFKNAF
ncbi:MAG: CBS domain-containing protein [Cyanobacteria bacterium CRU_2_1]|nr:CBS domain-containing protein [Cyanobacteria bacterium CRU_2_1]